MVKFDKYTIWHLWWEFKKKRIEWIRKGLENKPSLNDYLRLWELGVFSLCVLKFCFFYTWQMGLSAENSPIEQCVCFVSSRKIDHRLIVCVKITTTATAFGFGNWDY